MKVCNLKTSRNVLAAFGLSISLVSVSVGSTALYAGGGGVGHTHSKKEATKDEVLDTAKKVKDKLISDGKVDATWKDIDADNAEKKLFGKKDEWVVTFKDPKAADKAKETLYMFFSSTGNYLAVNHTGK